MGERNQSESARTVLLAAAVNSPVASRMAIRFAQAGCRVAAIYPSTKHLLGCTRAVEIRHHYSMIHPVDALVNALRASGAEVVIPCDGLALRHLHALYSTLPAADEGAEISRVIERSLGDSTAYLVIDSRHEVQVAARAEDLSAAESFAIGSTTDPESIARVLPFPWILKTDYAWAGRGSRHVHNLAQARNFIRHAGAPPSLSNVLRQLVVHGDRAAMGEWVHALQPGLSAQRPVAGTQANAAAACWRGDVMALLAVEVLATAGHRSLPAKVRIVEDPQMEMTVRRMARRLGLSGFCDFEFVLEEDSGQPCLTEINAHCAPPAHVNAGTGRDAVAAFYLRWVGTHAAQVAPVHPAKEIAYFPQAWAVDPDDPALATSAYDVPQDDQELVDCMMRFARRDRQYLAFRQRMRSLLKARGQTEASG
jgi:hypothetical protein